MTHLSLFSGIGGLDIAAEWAGFTTVGQCEWADYPTKVLEKHWPDVPRWRDIRTLTKEGFYERTGLRTVDLISGGFPCQPFSCAGKRRGKEDDRYLWPEMLRVIEELRPRWVVGENVANIVNMALDTVLADLESIGYTCQAFVIPACAVDAPHRRDRCAIVANTNSPQRRPCEFAGNELYRKDAGRQEKASWAGTSSKDGGAGILAYADKQGLQEREQHETPYTGGETKSYQAACQYGEAISNPNEVRRDLRGFERSGIHRGESSCNEADSGGETFPNAHGEQRHGSQPFPTPSGQSRLANAGGRPAEPGLGGMADGFPHWLDEPVDVPRIVTGIKDRVNRLKCLGNAVVPQQFYPIFQAIAEIEGGRI